VHAAVLAADEQGVAVLDHFVLGNLQAGFGLAEPLSDVIERQADP
jgi:hypothetical protein